VLARSLEATRQREEEAYQRTLKRIEVLVRNIGQFLLERDGGEEIELTVATRTLPFPAEIRQGVDLDDKRFLQYEANSVIGRFSGLQLGTSFGSRQLQPNRWPLCESLPEPSRFTRCWSGRLISRGSLTAV